MIGITRKGNLGPDPAHFEKKRAERIKIQKRDPSKDREAAPAKPLSCHRLYTLLREEGFNPSRRLGQNFLVDDNIREIILDAARIEPDEGILEIGPGNGALTVALLNRGARVWAVEKDPFLASFLQEILGEHPSFNLVRGDAMRTPLEDLPPRKLVANLPYNITSPLLYRAWNLEERFPYMVLMVQWEVAQRITAPPGDTVYSTITVLMNTTYEVEIVHRVSRSCFRPVPEVDSAIVKITWKGPALGSLKNNFKSLVEAGFRHRRKTLINSLRRTLPRREWEGLFRELGIPPETRAQELSPEQWLTLAREAGNRSLPS